MFAVVSVAVIVTAVGQIMWARRRRHLDWRDWLGACSLGLVGLVGLLIALS